MTGEEVQLSVAVAVPVFAGRVEAEQLMVIFAGHVIMGFVLSTTLTVLEQFDVHENASVIISCTVNDELQAEVAWMETVCRLLEPTIVPAPETDQAYVVIPGGAV